MKLLADENIPLEICEKLRQEGIDVKLNFDTLISEKGMNKGIGRLRERGLITGKNSGRKTYFEFWKGLAFLLYPSLIFTTLSLPISLLNPFYFLAFGNSP